jgi:hypothetical protein
MLLVSLNLPSKRLFTKVSSEWYRTLARFTSSHGSALVSETVSGCERPPSSQLVRPPGIEFLLATKPAWITRNLFDIASHQQIPLEIVAHLAPDINRPPVLQLLRPCRVLSAGTEHKQTGKETHMDTLTNKLAAFAGSLFMNTLVMGAVAYCFALQPNTYMTAVALAKAVATQQGLG